MPEGDDVWQTARRLEVLSGHVLTRTDFRVPSAATVDLGGRRVLETVSRGKHLLTRVDGDVTIHSHLRMEGRWDVHPAGSRWRRPAHEARAVLHTDALEAVGFAVVLDLVPTSDEARAVGHLGPDLLGPDWDEAEAVRRLGQAPGVPVGEALLDQRCLAGLGNIYKSEILFLSGLAPTRRVGDVPDLRKVVHLAQRLIAANRDRPLRVTTGVARKGRQYWVYGRARRPCRRCSTPIVMERQGDTPEDRVTYWCPSCQPEASRSRRPGT
jgi:endonuclease-8